jgi:excisionase family DNA binding protein
MTDEQYYTIEEVARMLKVAYLTVYRMETSRQIESKLSR